jgi:hypothetical protein
LQHRAGCIYLLSPYGLTLMWDWNVFDHDIFFPSYPGKELNTQCMTVWK